MAAKMQKHTAFDAYVFWDTLGGDAGTQTWLPMPDAVAEIVKVFARMLFDRRVERDGDYLRGGYEGWPVAELSIEEQSAVRRIEEAIDTMKAGD